MASIREIRRRIGSVKKIQKITDAMGKVASIKMRRARDQILNARPYARKLSDIAGHLKAHASGVTSPLLVERPQKKISLVVFGSDKGLCGAFNSNVVRTVRTFLRDNRDKEVLVTVVGKKPSDALRRWNLTIIDKYLHVFIKPKYDDAMRIGEKQLQTFVAGGVDAVYVVYNEFKSLASQKPQAEQLLPVKPPDSEGKSTVDYLFEPDPAESLSVLLSRYFMFEIWRVMLESFASEQASRMAAMNGATKNAGDLIGKLTLFYNKARQASITKELLEIVAGADALK